MSQIRTGSDFAQSPSRFGPRHSTTYLLGVAETYIDVHMANDMTASHHRVCALQRELPPNLTRLTEDHGVCLSSCLDYREDDLILQAFNRNLILAPQIYANPWFLNDKEFSKLAFIFNLHKQYRAIMVSGMVLPEKQYGPYAVSRGDAGTRLITLRNLTWSPVHYTIDLDQTIGLENPGRVKVTQYHPFIELLGEFDYGQQLQVEVLPFRSCLVKVSTAEEKLVEILGVPYEIVQDIPEKLLEIRLLGMPGQSYPLGFRPGQHPFTKVVLENKDASVLLTGRQLKITFAGKPLKQRYHRKIAVMQACDLPPDAESLYYATCFAADNNALEVRSLKRSGPTNIEPVKNARDAFFSQAVFIEREIWDKFLFDGDPKTAFSASLLWGDQRLGNVSLCLDLVRVQHLDRLTLETFDEYSLLPLKSEEGQTAFVSSDLKNWQAISFLAGTKMELDLSTVDSVRYIRVNPAPLRIGEIRGYKDNAPVARENWRASNLFKTYVRNHWQQAYIFKAHKSWTTKFVLDEIPKNSYLCVAINGTHEIEGAYAAFKIAGQYVGCPDRSPSFPSNSWEVPPRKTDKNNTYYLPLTPDLVGKPIEAFVLAFNPEHLDLRPEVWISAYPIPFEAKKVLIYR